MATRFGYAVILAISLAVCVKASNDTSNDDPVATPNAFDGDIREHAKGLFDDGRRIFRNDTFGNERFWGDALHLHHALLGSREVEGLTPRALLELGLKLDADALPAHLARDFKNGSVKSADVSVTAALLKANAIVGVVAVTDSNEMVTTVGLSCALCHSSVDDSIAAGIGQRLDGWANRDLDVGWLISLAPNLQPLAQMLNVDEAQLKKVLRSWGAGCFDAVLDKDGKAFRPDGKRACTLVPPAFGMAGINLHGWTGFGSVPYWSAYIAATELHGVGTFVDSRLNAVQFPSVAKGRSRVVSARSDQLADKQAALHYYQLSIPAPPPPADSYDGMAAVRGKALFGGKARCGSCHVPPLFTEPGHNLHDPAELGIDAFQADRSPTHSYRTTPLAGLWTHTSAGFYHDGRFTTLDEVIAHYDAHFRLGLEPAEKTDLVEYLKSL
ncbi:MAG: hypothetical protein K1X64_18695 [Myxococcaceae bacterium]|nr:hypothetical protein [Myxococcaceae bacterium]